MCLLPQTLSAVTGYNNNNNNQPLSANIITIILHHDKSTQDHIIKTFKIKSSQEYYVKITGETYSTVHIFNYKKYNDH